MEHANERQVAVALREVESITDDEEFGNGKAYVIGSDFFNAVHSLFQQHAGFDSTWLQLPHFAQYAMQRSARVEDVVHEEDVAATDVQAELLREDQLAGLGAEPVAGDADEIEAERQGEAADQIGEEKDGAIEDGDDDEFASGEIALDLCRKGFDAAGNLALRDEDLLQLVAPMPRNGARIFGLGSSSHCDRNILWSVGAGSKKIFALARRIADRVRNLGRSAALEIGA